MSSGKRGRARRKTTAGPPALERPPLAPPAPMDLAAVLAAPEGRGEAGAAPVDWSRAFGHLTVLGPETIEALAVKGGGAYGDDACGDGVYVDATLGGGGHSRLILEALGPQGRLLALDQDPEPCAWALEGWGRGEGRLTVRRGNFADLPEILADLGWGCVDGIVADLGLSSRQLAVPNRGFSWNHDETLDMRLDPSAELSAWHVVNRYREKELADLIWRYGEERASRRLARAIVEARKAGPVETTGELAALIAKCLYRPGPPPRLHPATRAFMALRIEVNRELGVLEDFLAAAPGLLKPGGRLAAISFHSLEDRLVKEAFRSQDAAGRAHWRPLFKKPLGPGAGEAAANPRARSARLRAAVLTAPVPI